MPVIKVWCLPKIPEDWLRKLHKDIVYAVTNVKELGLSNENDMTCLFDMMSYGLGEEIIIEVTGLFKKPERTDEVRLRLATELGRAVDAMFPNALVECFVYPFEPNQGFWCNRSMSI